MNKRKEDKSASRTRRAAFSLIELLVAMAVLAILLVLLSQMFSMVTGIWRAGRAQVDNFAQARVALDMMSRDLEAAVLRHDLPAFFVAGAPQLSFYTRQQSLVTETNGGDRPLSRVSYGVTNAPSGSSLRRSSRGYNFGDDIAYSPTNWSVPLDGPSFDSDIGPGVLILRQQFTGTNGLNILPGNLHVGWTNSGTHTGVGALRAITLSIAVIDRETLRLLLESGKLPQLQANFSTADPGPLRSFARAWQEQLDDPAAPFAAGGVPRRILRGLRIFERTVSLPLYPE